MLRMMKDEEPQKTISSSDQRSEIVFRDKNRLHINRNGQKKRRKSFDQRQQDFSETPNSDDKNE
jgi:hypothetical protein